MKNFYLISLMAFSSVMLNGQCTIDPAAQPFPGISPSPASTPCVVRGQAFDQTLQVQCATSFDTSITIPIINTSYGITVMVDSMELDSVIGLPNGITWVKNPYRLKGGRNGCLTFTGTTNDAYGIYNLLWYGTIWGSIAGPIPPPFNAQTYTGVLNQIPGYNYYLNVIDAGQPCVSPAAINDLNASLNAAIQVFPNPNKGVFEISINAGSRLNGSLDIIDITGKLVYHQTIDALGLYTANIDISSFAKGLYSLQLKTATGFASKTISVQ